MARNEQVFAHQKLFPNMLAVVIRASVVVHLYSGFSMWRQTAPQQSAKFRTALMVNFVPV